MRSFSIVLISLQIFQLFVMYQSTLNRFIDHSHKILVKTRRTVTHHLIIILTNFCSDTYFTPQMKRKRINDQSMNSSLDSLELMLVKFKESMVDMNRKLDVMNEREAVAQKKFENLEKSLGRILHKVHQVQQCHFSLLTISFQMSDEKRYRYCFELRMM